MTPYNNVPNLFQDTVTGARGAHNVLVYLPPDYLTKQYPCVYFFNGQGEDTGGVAALAKYSILYEIAVNGYQPKCIAMCVQAVGWDSQQNQIYTSLKKKYNIGKVVLTGISEGGWVCTAILAGINMPSVSGPGPNNPVQADTVCFIDMSSQADGSSTGWPPAVAPIVASGIPVVGSGDIAGDIHAIDTNNFILALQKANSKGNYVMINTPGTGHGGWNTLSNPAYKLPNGQPIWDWALSFAGPSNVVTPPAPVAKTLKSAVFTYSDGTTTTTDSTKTIKSIVTTYSDGSSLTLP